VENSFILKNLVSEKMISIKYITDRAKLQEGKCGSFPCQNGKIKKLEKCFTAQKAKVFHSLRKNKIHEKGEFYTVSTEFSTDFVKKWP